MWYQFPVRITVKLSGAVYRFRLSLSLAVELRRVLLVVDGLTERLRDSRTYPTISFAVSPTSIPRTSSGEPSRRSGRTTKTCPSRRLIRTSPARRACSSTDARFCRASEYVYTVMAIPPPPRPPPPRRSVTNDRPTTSEDIDASKRNQAVGRRHRHIMPPKDSTTILTRDG